MQKILIGVNTGLECDDDFRKILIELFGETDDYWINSLCDRNKWKELRKSEILHNYFIDKNYILRKENVRYIGDDFYSIKEIKVKIIEIPDDVEWYVDGYSNFNCGETIIEEHRKWD